MDSDWLTLRKYFFFGTNRQIELLLCRHDEGHVQTFLFDADYMSSMTTMHNSAYRLTTISPLMLQIYQDNYCYKWE